MHEYLLEQAFLVKRKRCFEAGRDYDANNRSWVRWECRAGSRPSGLSEFRVGDDPFIICASRAKEISSWSQGGMKGGVGGGFECFFLWIKHLWPCCGSNEGTSKAEMRAPAPCWWLTLHVKFCKLLNQLRLGMVCPSCPMASELVGSSPHRSDRSQYAEAQLSCRCFGLSATMTPSQECR